MWQIAHDYSEATLLLRLPGFVPMPAFAAVEDVPLVVRKAVKTRSQVGAAASRQHCFFDWPNSVKCEPLVVLCGNTSGDDVSRNSAKNKSTGRQAGYAIQIAHDAGVLPESALCFTQGQHSATTCGATV